MKTIVASLAVAVGLSVTSCSFNTTGSSCKSDKIITDSMSVPAFTKVDASASKVVYIPSNENKLVCSMCDDIADRLDVSVKKGTLYIGVKGGRENHTLDVVVYGTSVLTDVDARGACAFMYDGDIDTRSLDVDCSGASSFTLTGRAVVGDLDVDCSGASRFNAADVECATLSVDCSGASSADISGKCNKADYDASGASHISASRMEAVDANADASGASSINCYASGRLRQSASGVSSVKNHASK